MVNGDYPEVKLARRIFAKHKLSVPVKIKKLIGEYAELIFEPIPIEGVDGVSLNISVPGKETKVIVNTNIPKKRQLFTMAHELGHLIIPWHLGTIADNINTPYSEGYKDFAYAELEREANRFAAELLMPKDWILEQYQSKSDLASLHEYVCDITGVSDQAAAIRMGDVLPGNVVYASVTRGIVKYSGKTPATMAFALPVNERFDSKYYPYSEHHSEYDNISSTIHWWKLNSGGVLSATDSRTWREILDEIVKKLPNDKAVVLKKSINSVIAAANSYEKRKPGYTLDTLATAFIYKLKRDDFKILTNHSLFEVFVKKKAEELFSR